MKYYFQKHDENCYPKQYHIDYMKVMGIDEMEIFEAKRELGTGFFFCKHFEEIGEVGESCGRQCEKYKPMNGKSGRCIHHGFVYEQTEKVTVLKRKRF